MRIEHILKTNSNIALSKSVIVNLLYTHGIVIAELNKVLKPHDLSLQQFNVLRILRGQNGKPICLSVVQDRMISKMSNTTRLVDKLIIKNLVTKQINTKNKRKIDISITKDGLTLLSTIDGLISGKEDEIAGNLTKEEASEIVRLLGKLRLIAN